MLKKPDKFGIYSSDGIIEFKEFLANDYVSLIFELFFTVIIQGNQTKTFMLGYELHLPDRNEIGGPKDSDVNLKLIKGPNYGLDNFLVMSQDPDFSGINSNVFDFTLNVFISPSNSKPNKLMLNKLARQGTAIDTTYDQSSNFESNRDNYISSIPTPPPKTRPDSRGRSRSKSPGSIRDDPDDYQPRVRRPDTTDDQSKHYEYLQQQMDRLYAEQQKAFEQMKESENFGRQTDDHMRMYELQKKQLEKETERMRGMMTELMD